MTSTAPTIAKLQTPPGRGGIAVITLTGPEAKSISDKIFHPHTLLPASAHTSDEPDALQLGFLRDEKEKIDEAIICHSSLGCEINIHGGSAVARRVMRRLAELGAEVDAQNEDVFFDPVHPVWRNPAIGREMLASLQNAAGLLSTAALSQQWSAGLSELVRLSIDEITDNPASPLSSKLAGKLQQAAGGYSTMLKLLNPAEVVLAGPPNAGKSTLANLLTGRPVSIVHDTAGTTRDWVRELAIINGVPIWLTDTAGLWESAEDIDAEAVRRAWQKIEQAELILLTSHDSVINLPENIHAKNILHVATKTDLSPEKIPAAELAVSANTGKGIGELKNAVIDRLGLGKIDPRNPMAFTQRQVDLINNALKTAETQNADACKDFLIQILE